MEVGSQAAAANSFGDTLFHDAVAKGFEFQAQGSAEQAALTGAKERLRNELSKEQFNIGVDVQLGPVDKPRPDADASEQDESHEAGGELVIPGGDAPLLLEMANEALNP